MQSELEAVLRKRRSNLEDSDEKSVQRCLTVPSWGNLSELKGLHSIPRSAYTTAASSPRTTARWSCHGPATDGSVSLSWSSRLTPSSSSPLGSTADVSSLSQSRSSLQSSASQRSRLPSFESRLNACEHLSNSAPGEATPRTELQQKLGDAIDAISYGTPTWYSWTLAYAERGRRHLVEVPLLVATVAAVTGRVEAWAPESLASRVSDGIQTVAAELEACNEALNVYQNPQALASTPQTALRAAENALMRGKPRAMVRALATVETSRKLTALAYQAAYGWTSSSLTALQEVATHWGLQLQACAAAVERYAQRPRMHINITPCLMDIDPKQRDEDAPALSDDSFSPASGSLCCFHDLAGFDAADEPEQVLQWLADRRQQQFPASSVL